ncbi:MAG: tetratricopeptide repeat protein [Deltaproteobacteria bacterium]
MRRLRPVAAALVAAFGLARAAPGLAESPPDPRELAARVDAIEKGLQAQDDQLNLVERGYVQRLKEGGAESLEQRFGKAELYFLLQDYVAASVLLYDLVLNPQFHSSRHYEDGVYYLGESLYHQKDYLGAKQFLRQVIDLGPGQGHFEDALGRYLDIAARTRDFRDMDRYVSLSRQNGHLSPGVQYLLAKAAFERTDLGPTERLGAAMAAFAAIPPGPHYLKARYYIGVCEVELGELRRALAQFQAVVQAAPTGAPDEGAIQELGWLAIGRIQYQLGNYQGALDAYQAIPESSASFYDALYEIAWTYVKKGAYENAGKAVDLILLGAPDTKLTPSVNLLKGQLLLKLQKYADAEETFNLVINKYGPVRDEIDALLRAHDDPAAYFEQLLAAKGKTFDVATLLPPAAQPWANSRTDVGEAQAVVADLGDSQRGIAEGRQIVERLEQRISSAGSMDAFPALQAGYARAGAVDSALVSYDRQLVGLEQELLAHALSPADQQALAAAQAERQALEAKFDALPKSETQVDARRTQMVERLATLEKELFRLSLVIQSERAQLVAVHQMQEETAAQRKASSADEAKFAGQVQQELSGLDELDVEVSSLRTLMKDDQSLASGADATGDAQVREAYATAVSREAELLARARQSAGSSAGDAVRRAAELHARIAALRKRAASSLGAIRQAAIDQAEVIRQKVSIEAKNLEQFDAEVTSTSAHAGGLVGKIAFASFRHVRQSFYDLVLKADVGIIDVAWTRKRDETDKIQKLATDEDRELRLLDDDFKEVLGDVK